MPDDLPAKLHEIAERFVALHNKDLSERDRRIDELEQRLAAVEGKQ